MKTISHACSNIADNQFINIQQIKSHGRIVWIDICRVLTMLCIIASHANVWNYFSDNIIGAWSVFVFFFISALFIKQDSKKALNYSRFLKLFIPYLLWCLIGALIYFKFNLHAIYANMVAVFGCNIFNTFPAYGILWFLRELLLLSLVSPLLSKLNDAALLLFTVIFQILGAAPELIYHAGLDDIPFLFKAQGAYGMSWFLLGIFCARRKRIHPSSRMDLRAPCPCFILEDGNAAVRRSWQIRHAGCRRQPACRPHIDIRPKHLHGHFPHGMRHSLHPAIPGNGY